MFRFVRGGIVVGLFDDRVTALETVGIVQLVGRGRGRLLLTSEEPGQGEHADSEREELATMNGALPHDFPAPARVAAYPACGPTSMFAAFGPMPEPGHIAMSPPSVRMHPAIQTQPTSGLMVKR